APRFHGQLFDLRFLLFSSASSAFIRGLSTAHLLCCSAGSLPAGVVLSTFWLFPLRRPTSMHIVHNLHNGDCGVFGATSNAIDTFVHMSAISKNGCICIMARFRSSATVQTASRVHCSACYRFKTFIP